MIQLSVPLVSEVISNVILEIRFYYTYNFVGNRIDGCEEAMALLTKEAAAALKEVAAVLTHKPNTAALVYTSENDWKDRRYC